MAGSDCIDELLTSVGLGIWMAPIFLVVSLVNMGQLFLVSSTLLSIAPPFRCLPAQPDVGLDLPDISYLVPDSLAPDAGPPVSGEGGAALPQRVFDSQCLDSVGLSLRLLDSSNVSSSPLPPSLLPQAALVRHAVGLPSCPVVEYDLSATGSSVVSEFDLVCERATLKPLFQTMVSLGSALGCVIVGPLADSYGRKRALQIGMLVFLPAGVGVTLVPWFSAVLVLRLVFAASGRLCFFAACSLTMESISPHRRTAVGLSAAIPHYIMILVFAGVGLFIHEWRHLHLVSAIPVFLLVPLVFMVEESPRWLAQNGEVQRAVEQLLQRARLGGVLLPPALLSGLEKLQVAEETKGPTPGLWAGSGLEAAVRELRQYLRCPPMLTILLAAPLLWFLVGVLYTGIMLNASNFTSDNVELYLSITAVLGVAMLGLAVPVTQRLGRKVMVGGTAVAGGLLLLLDLAVPADTAWLKWLLVMTAIAVATIAYQTVSLFASELYPTMCRTRGVGMCDLVGNIGLALVPLVIDLLGPRVWWGPGAVLGGVGVAVSLLMPLLPETNNTSLPDTLQDVEDRHRRWRAAPGPAPASAPRSPQDCAV